MAGRTGAGTAAQARKMPPRFCRDPGRLAGRLRKGSEDNTRVPQCSVLDRIDRKVLRFPENGSLRPGRSGATPVFPMHKPLRSDCSSKRASACRTGRPASGAAVSLSGTHSHCSSIRPSKNTFLLSNYRKVSSWKPRRPMRWHHCWHPRNRGP